MALPLQADKFASINDAINGLKSPEYSQREAASQYLWEHAELDLLTQYSNDPDPEVRYRIDKLTTSIRSGITPQTPEAIKTLVLEFNEADLKRKVRILSELKELNAYLQIFALNQQLPKAHKGHI